MLIENMLLGGSEAQQEGSGFKSEFKFASSPHAYVGFLALVSSYSPKYMQITSAGVLLYIVYRCEYEWLFVSLCLLCDRLATCPGCTDKQYR